MRKELIAAASALALMTGAALAQTNATTPGSAGAPPSAGNVNEPGSLDSGSTGTAGPADTTMQQHSTSGSAASPSTTAMSSVEQWMGKTVVGSDGEEIGEVEDVILDPQSGSARQLVISSGGFLGIGEKQIAVDLSAANMNAAEDQIVLSSITQADVENLPEFQYTDSMTSLSRQREGAPNTGVGTGTRTGNQ